MSVAFFPDPIGNGHAGGVDRGRLADVQVPVSAPLGLPGRFAQVSADVLRVDPEYQREPDKQHVGRIVRQFVPDIFGVVWVSQRADGSLWIIDGQHRVAAVLAMGWADRRVPCFVISGLTPEDEARIFAETQRLRKPLRPEERFKAALAAGDGRAHRVRATVEGVGYRLALHARRDETGIKAIGAIEHLDQSYVAGTLKEVLELCWDAWGTGVTPGGLLLRGLAMFASRHRGRYDRARLVAKLQAFAPIRLEGDGKDQARLNGCGMPDGVCRHVEVLYNQRLSARNKLPVVGSG